MEKAGDRKGPARFSFTPISPQESGHDSGNAWRSWGEADRPSGQDLRDELHERGEGEALVQVCDVRL